jgi:hypothetical protein
MFSKRHIAGARACTHTHTANIFEPFYSQIETKLWNKPFLFRIGKDTKSHPALCYPAENSQITLLEATNFSAAWWLNRLFNYATCHRTLLP